MKARLPVFLLVLLASQLRAQDKPQPAEASPAATTPVPQAIDPAKIEAALVPEKNTILLGEPIFVTFTLRNKGSRDLGACLGDSAYYNDPADTRDYFKFTITDAQDNELAQIPGNGPPLTIFAGDQTCKFSAGGEYTAPLFLPTRIIFDKPGDYTIAVSKRAEFSFPNNPQKNPFDYSGTILTIDRKATTTIKVLPADPEKMGHLIDELGEKMVAYGKSTTQHQMEEDRIQKDWFHGGLKAGEGYFIVAKFTAIHDERMIPWLLRTAVTSCNISFRQESLRALATFDSDAAFNALKTAMATPDDKVVDAPWESNSDEPRAPSKRFRETVLWAITGSKHPGAIAYALTFRHDPNYMMRFWVTNMACLRMNPEESVPVLRELAADTDPRVSRDAKAGLYRACRQIKPEEAIPILRELAADSDRQLSADAKAALGEVQKKLESGSSRPQ